MNIKAVRAFRLKGGTVVEPGPATINVDDITALDAIASGKAVRAAEVKAAEPAPSPGPMTTETAAGVVSGKRSKAPKE